MYSPCIIFRVIEFSEKFRKLLTQVSQVSQVSRIPNCEHTFWRIEKHSCKQIGTTKWCHRRITSYTHRFARVLRHLMVFNKCMEGSPHTRIAFAKKSQTWYNCSLNLSLLDGAVMSLEKPKVDVPISKLTCRFQSWRAGFIWTADIHVKSNKC